MKRLIVLLVLFAVSGCDQSGSNNSASYAESPSPKAFESIEWFDDPLLPYQWHLYNAGDTALVPGAVMQPGADINILSAGIVLTTNLVGTDFAQGKTGQGVIVAVVDTGLEMAHVDLVDNLVINGSYNFAYPLNGKGLNDPTPTSYEDHGTSVAGLLGARGGNGIGISGVAPGVQLKGFNFLISQSLDKELAALGAQSASFVGLNNQNISVFNMSYGYNPTIAGLSSYEQAVLNQLDSGTALLRDNKGALYIKAAGNEYWGGGVFSTSWCQSALNQNVTCYNANMEPLNTTPHLIVVGALNASDQRASYSNTGSAVWLSAPGGESVGMLTTDISGCLKGYAYTDLDSSSEFDQGVLKIGGEFVNSSCSYTTRFIGTSAATPIVSGAVALLLQANPDLSWREIKHILAKTARQIQPTLTPNILDLNDGSVMIEQGWTTNQAGFPFSNHFGFGGLDVQAAISEALSWKNSQQQLAAPLLLSLDKVSYSQDNQIADKSAVGLTKTRHVEQTAEVESVLLELTIRALDVDNPIDASDYLIHLVSPSGTVSVLQTPFNAFRSGYDIDAMRLITHAFYGEGLAGNWTLKVWDVNDHQTSNSTPDMPDYDNAIKAPGNGQLVDWRLTFYGRGL